MLPEKKRKQIIDLINREVVPAMGCTEPIAVSLCAARAAELLAQCPDKIDVFLSANILKNAMGVGIPGTGMIGLPIAIALGATIGKSQYELEVLKDVTPQAVSRGKEMIDAGIINIQLRQIIRCVCAARFFDIGPGLFIACQMCIHRGCIHQVWHAKQKQTYENGKQESIKCFFIHLYPPVSFHRFDLFSIALLFPEYR